MLEKNNFIKLDICIPCFNEEKILATSTKRVLNYCENNLINLNWQIVLVINGSTDNSEKIAQKLAHTNKHINYIIYQDPGRGQALKKYWLKSGANILAYMDSDLAVELEALVRLIEPLKNNQADLVIGNRYHKNSQIKRSLLREIVSRFYNFLARLIVHSKQPDLQCGFKAINKNAFMIIADKITSPKWFFDTELVLWAEKNNLKIQNISINWHETRLGKRTSKVSLITDIAKFLKELFNLRKRLKSSL